MMGGPADNGISRRRERLARQSLLPGFGAGSAEALASARAVVLGLGALGTVAADLLVRAGVGTVRVIDRDVVERSNLHRQTLYTEADAEASEPKAVAAARALRAIDPSARIEAFAEDFSARNAERLAGCDGERRGGASVLIDATDNFAARLLLNDIAVKHGVPMVYGGAVGTRGMLMTVLPAAAEGGPPPPWADPDGAFAGGGAGPCLRCVMGDAPAAGSVETCESAGVLGTVSAAVACFQATEALKVLLGRYDKLRRHLLSFDPWNTVFGRVDASPAARDPSCPCCGLRRFDFLDDASAPAAVAMCGRDAVQVRGGGVVSLDALADRLSGHAEVRRSHSMLYIEPHRERASIALFADGRAIVRGTGDPGVARAIFERVVGR